MPDNARPALILTRPAAAAARFCDAARGMLAGVEVILSPVLDIRALPATLPRAGGDYAGVIFTSENGAAQGLRLGLPAGLPAYCVGGQTARAAQAAGFVPQTAGGDAESLLVMLVELAVAGPLVHVRGAHARGAVAARLAARGVPTDEVVAYDQRALPLTAAARAALLQEARPVVLPLYSPRSAALLAAEIAALPGAPAAPVHLAAISAAAAAPFEEFREGGRVASCHVAQAPLGPEMTAAVGEAITAAREARDGGL